MITFEDKGIKTKPGRARYATICPECNDKRTRNKGALCLTVNDEPGNRWFKCHHCGWSGNLDVMGHYDKVLENSKMPSESKKKHLSLKARAYLEKRGFSAPTIKECRIYDFVGRGGETMICFPYFMNLTLVNVKFRNIDYVKGESSGPRMWQLPQSIGTRIIAWNMQNIRFENDEGVPVKKELIITEGEIDTMTWVEAGFHNVISVPQGAPSVLSKNFTKEFSFLEDPYVKSVFGEIETFYLAVDNDEPGRLLRHHLAMLLGKDKCRIIAYPPGYKDINEVLAGEVSKKLPALGVDGVRECFANPRSVPVAGVLKPHHVKDDLLILRKDGFLPGLGCGIPEVDRLFTVKPKHITFVTGVPGCFTGDQLIHTQRGVVPISEVTAGDKVLSYDHRHLINEYRDVTAVHHYKERKDRLFKITLRDGTIIKVTEDHEFYTGTRYVKIKDIVLPLTDKHKK